MQSFAIQVLIMLIKAYQRTLSPDHSWLRSLFPFGACRYQPTCSAYAIQSLEVYGLPGLYKSLVRLGRCHPFAAGGHDPVKKV